MNALLTVDNLAVHFETPEGRVEANRGVSLAIQEGETFGLMGESGCGKSVLAMSILRLQQPGRIVKGSITLNGVDLTTVKESELQKLRGRVIGLVPQDVSSALNPLQTIGFHIREAMVEAINSGVAQKDPNGNRRLTGAEHRQVVSEALRAVCLPAPEELLHRYPHQLSVGMRQRVLLALAMLLEPRLLICDEPTTALDASTKARVLNLLVGLGQKSTMLLISHDAEAVRKLCHRVAVMYAGTIVESGPCEDVFESPLHPYARALLESQRYQRGRPLTVIPGDAPDLLSFPVGCAFHPRCAMAMGICSREEPPTCRLDGRVVVCHLYS